jgi:hypothetical protein
MCCVRIMTNNTNGYRQVKIHRKKKLNQDNVGMNQIKILFLKKMNFVFFSNRCSFNNPKT